MSHAATHWLATVPPDQMTHGEFRVMFHLCDCHNASMGCFPKQAYLRAHTGLSNGGLNKALAELEEKGLILRERDRDERTNRQKPTRYILGFEIKKAQEPSPLSGDGSGDENLPGHLHSGGDGAVSTQGVEPSPLSEGCRLHPGGVSYKDEPVKEPVNEPCAAPAHTSDEDRLFSEFLRVFPRFGDFDQTEAAFKAALEGGADPEHILAGARAYAEEQRGNRRQYIAYSQNWLKDQRWTQQDLPSPKVSEGEREAARWDRIVASIESGKSYLCTQVTAAQARHLIQGGRITVEQCRAVGVQT